MAKIARDTQDNLGIFQGALEKGIIDWATFFHLEQDQRASAEQILLRREVLLPDSGYKVSPGISGIVPASRAPAYFKDEAPANTLVEFYKLRNQKVSIEKI